MLNPPVNGKIQGLFQAFLCFSSTFRGKYKFQGLFKTVLYIQVLFKHVRTLLSPEVSFLGVDCHELPLTAAVLCQFLHAILGLFGHPGPPWPGLPLTCKPHAALTAPLECSNQGQGPLGHKSGCECQPSRITMVPNINAF